jgi:hypothetical protein
MPLSEARPSWRVVYWVLWAVRLAAAFAFLWAVDFNIDGSPHVAILLAAYVGFIAGGTFKSVVEFVWEVSDRGAPTRWWSLFAFPIVVMFLIFLHNEMYHWTPNPFLVGLVAIGAAYIAGRAVLWFVRSRGPPRM